jgi:hypothetical protein
MATDSVKISDIVPFVSTAVDLLANPLFQSSPLVGTGEEAKLQAPDRRLSWGVSKKNDKYVVAILVEKDDSWALRKAEELRSAYQDAVLVSITGVAQSSRPGDTKPQARTVTKLAPGLSVGHIRGYPGSLGCLVKGRTKGTDWPGFVSASHVLAINNTAEKEDPILQPGHPDGPRSLDNKLGTLANYIFLVHYRKGEEEIAPTNTEDVALVRLEDDQNLPASNLVPNPDDPERRITIKGCIPAERLFEKIEEPVYKIGRTSGFTSGILEFTNIQPYPIRLPDRKSYLFKDVACVRPAKGSFSLPGDSGSLVYSRDGMALGLIIGGSEEYTFISPFSSCLAAIGAELLV